MPEQRSFKYYDFLVAAFVMILLCANIIGAAKVTSIKGFTFGAGILFFPFSYIFGDILTEVYGYARARRVVWSGFAALIFASVMSAVIVKMPPAEGWPFQQSYEDVFAGTPRIALSSLVAFFCGEFTNSFVMAKMKVWMEGRRLWMRTISSTLIGEGVDSIIFFPLAFLGVWSVDLVLKVMVAEWFLKTMHEVVMTPFTYKIVNFLKRAEGIDHYDRKTNFTPFSLQTESMSS